MANCTEDNCPWKKKYEESKKEIEKLKKDLKRTKKLFSDYANGNSTERRIRLLFHGNLKLGVL